MSVTLNMSGTRRSRGWRRLEQTDREREVLTAKHQPLKHNKHRYQVFDDTGKIVVQQPMNHYRSKDDALVALHRLSAAKIEIED